MYYAAASLDSTSWESSSDASSLASSKSPLDLAVRGRPPGAASKRPGGMPVMTGSAGLPTIGAVGVVGAHSHRMFRVSFCRARARRPDGHSHHCPSP